MRFFHVTSVLNRASIDRHGLDWSRMGAAPGIAGSRRPEVDGCFLCTDGEADWFRDVINNTGGPVDVWAVDGLQLDELVESGSGFMYYTSTIARAQLTLVEEGEPDPAAYSK